MEIKGKIPHANRTENSKEINFTPTQKSNTSRPIQSNFRNSKRFNTIKSAQFTTLRLKMLDDRQRSIKVNVQNNIQLSTKKCTKQQVITYINGEGEI